MALDEDTGQELWKFNVAGPTGVGMLYVPTGKIQAPKGFEGSIVAFTFYLKQRITTYLELGLYPRAMI